MPKFFIFLLIIIIDQLTKYCATVFISPSEVINIFPFLNLCLVFNTGTSFGFLNSIPNAVIIITVLCILFLGLLYIKNKDMRVPLIFILGGAVSNLIDRFTYGAVVDFIDLFYKKWHWPAFNIADTVICLGCIYLIFKNHKHD